MTPLLKPHVHLNGTSCESLVEQYMDICIALRQAAAAMQTRRPHDRDYYVSDDPREGIKAREAFQERIDLILAWSNEFENMAYILDQDKR